MTPAMDYKTLSWAVVFGHSVPGQNEQAMFAMECQVARRILDALNTHPQGEALRARIQTVPFEDFPPSHRTEDLRLTLWDCTGAVQWVGSRNAISHKSLLWQFALVRLSAHLNTGEWDGMRLEGDQ